MFSITGSSDGGETTTVKDPNSKNTGYQWEKIRKGTWNPASIIFSKYGTLAGEFMPEEATSKETTSTKSNNITEELKELKKLYKSGDLSKKQFEKAKDKLLK